MVSYPRPRKPNTFTKQFVEFYRVVDKFDSRDGYHWYHNEYDVFADSFGRRSYGSGIRPDTNWKYSSDYFFGGLTQQKPAGEATWRHVDTGRIVRKDTGSAEGNYPTLYDSKFFESADVLMKGMPTNTRNRLDTEVMQKVGARKTSYGEALAESRQTVNHLSKTVKQLVGAALAARKGNWPGVAKQLKVPFKPGKADKAAAERWLEYQYGWLPMMSDIFDTHKLLKEGFRKPQIMHSVRVLRDNNYFHEKTGPYGFRTFEEEASYRCKVFYKVNESTLSNLNQMGLINPLEVAWAVVPYSFVVDWFLPVGNFLEALTAPMGVTFVDGFYGTRAALRGIYQGEPPGEYDATPVSYDMKIHLNRFGYSRQRLTQFPVPKLYLKDPFSTSHLTSALALIRQLVR